MKTQKKNNQKKNTNFQIWGKKHQLKKHQFWKMVQKTPKKNTFLTTIGGGCKPGITYHENGDTLTVETEKLCGAAGAKRKLNKKYPKKHLADYHC